MEEVLEQAAKRNLTLFGKVCIVKTLAISKIVYVSTCLTVPEKIIYKGKRSKNIQISVGQAGSNKTKEHSKQVRRWWS